MTYHVRVPKAPADVFDKIVWEMNSFEQLTQGRELTPAAVIALFVDSVTKLEFEPDGWDAAQMRTYLLAQGLLDP